MKIASPNCSRILGSSVASLWSCQTMPAAKSPPPKMTPNISAFVVNGSFPLGAGITNPGSFSGKVALDICTLYHANALAEFSRQPHPKPHKARKAQPNEDPPG